MDVADLGLLILRVWIGVVMTLHGVNHLRNFDGTARWFGRLGWRAPRYQALLSSWVEIAVGAGLILGLLTSIAAAGAAALMLVAYLTHHRSNGFFIFNKGEGYEYVITLAAAAAAVALMGAGGWSLDEPLGIDLYGAWRVRILAIALVLGAAHAMAWRRPGGTED